jgi:hypothetical protein
LIFCCTVSDDLDVHLHWREVERLRSIRVVTRPRRERLREEKRNAKKDIELKERMAYKTRGR